ncbi:hypothetical protein KR018_008389 [Drosophila ironensis]|nr:hypothetical protein KR018_008389 [Drosophila ironensis]
MGRLRTLAQRIWASDVEEGRIGSLELNVWLAQLMGLPLRGIFLDSKMHSLRVLAISSVVLTSLLCYVGLEIYDLVLNWADVDVMTQNVVMTLTHVGYWFKVINTFYHYSTIKGVVLELQLLTRTCVDSSRQRDTFHRVEVENKVVCLFYFLLVLVSSVVAFGMLLIVPDGMAGKRFPYRVRMPSALPPRLSQLYMGVCLVWISGGVTTIDNVNVLLMNQLCLHLQVLNLAFEELKAGQKGHDYMLTIVTYHSRLIGLRQRMERVYRLPVMFQFVSSLLVLAMTVFQTLVGDWSNSSLLIYLMLSGVLCQIFFYCWFGNEVFEQSKKLTTSAFGCNWLSFDGPFRKCLLIFMVNADRPLLFTAGGFMTLTLTSFASLLGKSYSVVAVLRHVYGRAV